MWHLMEAIGWISAQSTLFLEKQLLVSRGQKAPEIYWMHIELSMII
jgi:hypothetical protein